MNDLGTIGPDEDHLFGDLSALIGSARQRAAVAVNSELVTLHWHAGKRIREDVLDCRRGTYGERVLKRLAERLTAEYGRGWTFTALTRMLHFADAYPDERTVATLSQQLAWSHFVELIPIDDPVRRDFYTAFAARERWSVRTLRAQVDGKLYERTLAASGGDVADLERELAALRESGATPPALAFRDPYVLDFLGLPSEHSESDLEQAILDDMQRFLLELGAGFAFVGRQKRITVDGEDYHLDLLFYHLGMRCYVAIELKTRKLKPGDKGQMELYCAWLDRYERSEYDAPTLGLILCAAKGAEQVDLLGMDDGGIRAARYITEPLRERMRARLAEATRGLPESG